jgi:DNA-binding transcriptional regulator LsrR (DeoR family)
MMRFEGKLSVFEIANELNLDYWDVREYVEKFREQGLVDPLPIPSEAKDK